MRDRALALARDRYNWETAVAPYLALVEPWRREASRG